MSLRGGKRPRVDTRLRPESDATLGRRLDAVEQALQASADKHERDADACGARRQDLDVSLRGDIQRVSNKFQRQGDVRSDSRPGHRCRQA